jgi:hypothetical protein
MPYCNLSVICLVANRVWTGSYRWPSFLFRPIFANPTRKLDARQQVAQAYLYIFWPQCLNVSLNSLQYPAYTSRQRYRSCKIQTDPSCLSLAVLARFVAGDISVLNSQGRTT